MRMKMGMKIGMDGWIGAGHGLANGTHKWPGALTLQRLLGLGQCPALGLQLLIAGLELGQLLLQLEHAALQPFLLRPAERQALGWARGWAHPGTHLSLAPT